MIYRTETTDAPTGSVTVVEYDSDADTVTTTVDDGTPDVRPMTPDELAHYDERAAADAATVNVTQMTDESAEAVDKLVLVVESLNAITDLTNATINANPAAVIKDLARECKTIARQANREARMTSGRTDDTYTGPPDVV